MDVASGNPAWKPEAGVLGPGSPSGKQPSSCSGKKSRGGDRPLGRAAGHPHVRLSPLSSALGALRAGRAAADGTLHKVLVRSRRPSPDAPRGSRTSQGLCFLCWDLDGQPQG